MNLNGIFFKVYVNILEIHEISEKTDIKIDTQKY